MSHPLLDQHRKILDDAVQAIQRRTYFSAYPEVPSGRIYGEGAREAGDARFQERCGKPFRLEQPATVGQVGAERSPYGMALGITYPKPDLDRLLPAVAGAATAWGRAAVETRVGVCLEILARLNRQSFELASSVMHTSGQGYMMAFQAGGPHAQDRGLEAVAYAWQEMTRCPRHVTWRKQVSKTDVVQLDKTYRIVPRGVALVIGCSTFPTWNSYPGLFASLATGNAVVVKPHPGAILPLAITVETARAVLDEQGFDPNLVVLAADDATAPVTRALATRPEVRLIDYTGSSEFGRWLEEHATQAIVFTEKAGVNSVIIDSVADLRAVAANLAFSLSLYSGQMCTAPQNIYVPARGIDAGSARASFDEVAAALVKAVDGLLSDPQRAAEVLGAIQGERTRARVDEARAEALAAGGKVLRESQPVRHERFPEARTCSPLMLSVKADRPQQFMREMFGPISYVVATAGTQESLALAATSARELGAITASVYATNPSVMESAEDAMAGAGAAVSFNLTGPIYVNQAAAFSDFHVSGCNPAGNATLCDGAFVANRFRVAQSRVFVPQPAEAEAKAHARV